MNGGYGGGGRGTGGYPGPGYGGDGYGAGPGGPRQQGGQPQWEDGDPGWQRGQAGDRARGYGGQENAGYENAGYENGGQGYDGQGYDGEQWYDGQDYDRGGYRPGQGYPQPGGRPRPGAGPARPQRPVPESQRPAPESRRSRTGAQPVPGGTGARPAQRMPGQGTGGYPAAGFPPRGDAPRGDVSRGDGPRGDGPRGGGPRGGGPRGGDGYGPGGYEDWEPDPGYREDSFVPGFDRGGDPRDRDRRGTDGRRPRAGAPEGGPGRGPAGRGPRGRDEGRRGDGRRDDRENWERGGRDARPAKRRSPVRRFAPLIALAVILTLIGVPAAYVYQRYEARYHPPDYSGPGTGEVTVQVMSGDSAFSLAPRLVTLGVVASSRAFENAAEGSANTTGLEAGFYLLHRHMQASLAFTALLNPKNRVQTVVTIPEGKRATSVAAILAAKTNLPLKDFQQIIAHPAQLGLPSYANGKVEGFLFPDTYAIQPHETALQILQTMVATFKQQMAAINLPAAAAKVGLTPDQVIIEASMAQAEGGSVTDYPKIAEVIYNRLHQSPPMTLGFDSVLLYGLNAYGINVTYKQIATPGPYNDFKNAGLPPTPIANPGLAAISGVLHPAHGDYLYFLTVTGGKSEFSHVPLPGQ